MRPQGSAEELERRRRRAVALVQQGYPRNEVAQMVEASPSSVTRWCQVHEKRGDIGLAAKPPPGGKSKLTARQRKLLVQRLLKGAKANGFSTDLWTCPRIVQLIEHRYGVRYHVDHIPRLMASLGWSSQKPEKRAVERDEARIARWVAKDWAHILRATKAGARRRRM